MVSMASAGRGKAAAADKLVRGPAPDNKCKKKPPRKIHKAEREKHKRDHLNDLFVELGNMLEADRQSNGKACILSDTTRILRDLLSQLESLRKENITLQNESYYVTMERNEIQDENGALHSEILELQNKLTMRLAGNPGGGDGTSGPPALPVPRSASTVFPPPQAVQPPTMANTGLPLQQALQQPTVIERSHAAPPRELKLFPDAASVEGHAPSGDEETTGDVVRPQARYPAVTVGFLAWKPGPSKDGFQGWKMSNAAAAARKMDRVDIE